MKLGAGQEEVLFREALQRTRGPERETFLDQACAGNEALRARLQALLQAHERSDPFLEPPVGDLLGPMFPLPALDPGLALTGALIGRYTLLEQLGEGAFGVVYLAEQIQPVRRKVALKIIKAGMDTKEIIARFEAERQALALMDHPNIAKMLDGGATETGRPYFVMELVRGIPLTHYCDQNQLSTEARLNLFVQVCHAVQHAHQKGVIHRDLKPSNILVTLHDSDSPGVPMVIDFGVAKALGHKLTAKTLLTGMAQMIGTPAYMSPEQAELRALDIDTRSDIYSLGVLLYELLTGSTPFDTKELLQSGLDAMRKIIREREPVRPSTRLTRELGAAARKGAADFGDTDSGALTKRRYHRIKEALPLIRGDLDWIVMKCLEKDRARRYESASLLALDLGHHLHHEPVLARPPSRLYRVRKFIRRHRTSVLAAVMVFGGLLLGTTGALVGLAKASRERNRAQMILRQMDLQHAQDLFETDRAAEGLANLALLVREKPDDLPVVEWLLNEMTQRSFPLPLLKPIKHEDHVLSAKFSPDGRRILTVSRNNTAQIWDSATGRPLTPPVTHHPSLIRKNDFLEGLHPMFASFSPDGARVVTGATDREGCIWDAATGQMLTPSLPHPDSVSYVAFSPDGKWVATACKDGAVRLWNAATGEAVGKPFQHATWANFVEFSPGGDRILTGSDDQSAQVWDVASGARLGPPLRHQHELKHGEFSPDGGRVVTASADFTARIWNGRTGEPLSPPLKHDGIVCTARFSPDGGRVVTASFDKTARLWDGFSGEPSGQPMRHKSVVRSARFSPEGQRVVTASEDGTARIWDATTGEPLSEPMIHHGYVWSAEFDRAGRRILTASADATAQVWDARPGQALHHSFAVSAALHDVQWDGRRILTGVQRPQLWDVATGRQLPAPTCYSDSTGALLVRFSPDGRYFLTASNDGTVRIWPAGSRHMRTRPLRHALRVHHAEFSPDGGQVVTASADGTARVWSAQTGEPLSPPLEHRDIVFLARFSPSGREVLTASADGTAGWWQARTGTLLRPPLLHPDQVTGACFSADGRLAATVCKDMAARVWDLRSGTLISSVRHLGPINSAVLSSDGRWLLTASDDKTARVWQTRTGQPVSPPLVHNGHVLAAEFSPDGARLLTASDDGLARMWDAQSGQSIGEPFRHAKGVATARFHPQGNRAVTASFDHTARVWEIVRASKPAPPWLPALAECVAGQRLTAHRNFEPVAPAEWFRWRARPSEFLAEDAYARWARWFCADRSTRATSPSSTNSLEQFVAQLSEGRGPWAWEMDCLREASQLGGASARLHLQWLLRWQGPLPLTDRREIAELEWHAHQESSRTENASLTKALYWARRGDSERTAAFLDDARRSAGTGDYLHWYDWGETLFQGGRVEEGLRAFAQSIEQAEKIGNTDWVNDLRWLRDLKLLWPERHYDHVGWLKASGVLPRPTNAPPNLIDLSQFYTGALGGWFSHDFYGTGLRDMPQGMVELAGTRFDVRALVQLNSSKLATVRDVLAQKCSGIPINRCCRRLNFLQAADEAEENGIKVGAYWIRYADGQDHEIPILYGQDVLAWLDDSGATNDPGPTPVWQASQSPGITLRLFQTTWTNPRPDILIKTLDFVSAMTRSGPFLVAISAEP